MFWKKNKASKDDVWEKHDQRKKQNEEEEKQKNSFIMVKYILYWTGHMFAATAFITFWFTPLAIPTFFFCVACHMWAIGWIL